MVQRREVELFALLRAANPLLDGGPRSAQITRAEMGFRQLVENLRLPLETGSMLV
jgi:hypothetical protein